MTTDERITLLTDLIGDYGVRMSLGMTGSQADEIEAWLCSVRDADRMLEAGNTLRTLVARLVNASLYDPDVQIIVADSWLDEAENALLAWNESVKNL